MSNADVPHPPPGASHSVDATAGFDELRIYSHSPLFYWWPVWLFGFLFSLITLIDNNRMAIVPDDSLAVREKVKDKEVRYTVYGPAAADHMTKITTPATDEDKKKLETSSPSFPVTAESFAIKPRVSPRSWMGPTFIILLLLVIVITSVPLRGLWSLVALIGIVVLVLLISLFHQWDAILDAFIGLHVFINLAGYLLLSTVLCIAWAVSTFVFDRRSYIVFTPGQIRVCEEIGSRERTYDTTGMTIEKHRDDWFRHIFLGFGSGDLSVRTAGADRNEILMPNVALIGFKIDPIQQLIRQRQVDTTPNRPAS
jgi:hypothetical protein